MIQVLRLSSAWDKVQAPLQAWISSMVREFNQLKTVRTTTFRLVDGVSADPFLVGDVGRPAAVWIGALQDAKTPSLLPVPTLAWRYASQAGIEVSIGGLTSGREYQVTLCMVG